MDGAPPLLDFFYSEKPAVVANHRHACYQLLYVKAGEILIKIGEKAYTPSPGSLIFISNLEKHTITVNGSCYVRYYLNIQPALADSLIRDARLLSVFFRRSGEFCPVVPLSPYEQEVEGILKKIGRERQVGDRYTNELCALYLKELLVLLYRRFPGVFPAVDRKKSGIAFSVKQYIEQNFQKDISLKQLGETFHLSPCYLSHAFKQYTGRSIKQYLLLCRLEEARRRLAETEDSIIDVALESGFSDHSNFTRYFRQKTGMSPSKYRKENQ